MNNPNRVNPSISDTSYHILGTHNLQTGEETEPTSIDDAMIAYAAAIASTDLAQSMLRNPLVARVLAGDEQAYRDFMQAHRRHKQ